MLEWLKRHAWKACNRQKRFGSSNLPHSAINTLIFTKLACFLFKAIRIENNLVFVKKKIKDGTFCKDIIDIIAVKVGTADDAFQVKIVLSLRHNTFSFATKLPII